MSLELLGGEITENGIAVTFATEKGLETLEGTTDEVLRLAAVMSQVSAMAALNDDERVWLEDVAVGRAIVKLGLAPGGRVRVRILRF